MLVLARRIDQSVLIRCGGCGLVLKVTVRAPKNGRRNGEVVRLCFAGHRQMEVLRSELAAEASFDFDAACQKESLLTKGETP